MKNELYHYGIPGMRWGHRKVQSNTAESRRYKSSKLAYKQSKKEYNKAFNKAMNYSSRRPISQFVGKKAKAESDKRWADAYDKAAKLNKDKSDYKRAKKDYKQTAENKAKRAKAMKVGVAVVGTTLAAYGTYKASKIVKNKFANELADKIIRENGWDEIGSRHSFVRNTASTTTTRKAIKGLAEISSEKKRSARVAKRLANEYSQRAKNQAQMDYIRKMMANQKSNRTYI